MFIDHRYEVLESLGTGSWANVFKVRDVRTGNLYTLKLFQYLSSEGLYQHFKARDMHHITKIEHPNLSHVVDFGHVGDHIYFISDFFDGASLSNFRFSKNKISSLYNIIVQICYALNALHTQNILHNDIKPENILYKSTGNTLEVKLIDYGFSRLELDKDTQYVSGTLPYIAPEIYMGRPAGNSSDFYSLGVVIYRLITGSFPYTLEQINALRSGSQQYFIPIFPSELNPQVPLELEKLCLRLLERNPENRFQNSEEIINYINRTTGREFPFSVSWSLVNTLQFNSYTVREKIVEDLLEYLPQVENSNGKLISLVGGEGLGKDNILSLFRYNILRGTYFIFDYNCTKSDHDAFYALIKEYLQSLTPEELESYQSLSGISEKLRRYLFMSEQAAKGLSQTQADLKSDFEFSRSLLIELSKRKPVIFIIRNIQHVHRYTLDFINYFSNDVVKNRFLMLFSCTDFNKVKQIEHPILLHIPMFSLDESVSYIRKLLNTEVPEAFCYMVYQRSSGNPYFIREILIDLTLRKLITFDQTLRYPANLDDYALPSRIIHSIYSRMSHLTDANYKHLQKLSIVQTPISLDLIRYICKVDDNQLFDLLNDGKYNEILEKRHNHFFFTFPEAKERFFAECTAKLQQLVSLRVLKYYGPKKINEPLVYQGLIQNARIAGDPACERDLLLKLYALLDEDYEQEQAYEAISRVIQLDWLPEAKAGPEQKKEDLHKFQQKAEITGLYTEAGFIWENQRKIAESFEKYLVLGTLKSLAEDMKNAQKYFLKAEGLGRDDEQKAMARLYLALAWSATDPKRMKTYLDQSQPNDLPLPLRIVYTVNLGYYHSLSNDYDAAIKTIEDFLHELPPEQNPGVMIRLATLHNHLGEFYSIQKNIPEAVEHFNTALAIWNRYHVKRFLGLINNNLADLNLRQGFTLPALRYARTGLAYARELGLVLTQARSLLIKGEAYIKTGEYSEAEQLLQESEELVRSVQSPRYLQAIQRNLALAKSKIVGFGYYYNFIRLNQPQLIEGTVSEINPLVKTYFYYLGEMGNPKKLRRLISKNAQIDYEELHEQEFYHNVLSLLAISEKKYETALQELHQAIQYAGEINNHYAETVFNCLQAQCYYGLQDYVRAAELIAQTRPVIEANGYRYWGQFLDLIELKLDLMNPSLPLRGILRRNNQLLTNCENFLYYQLEVEFRQCKIQTLLELNVEAVAQAEFATYKRRLEEITAGISEDDRLNFLNANQYHLDDLKKFRSVPIASRRKDTRSKWNDLLFNITNVNSVQRIKFLVEKGINQVLSPWQFKLMVYSEKIDNFYTFLCYNCPEDSLFPPEFNPQIEKAFEADGLISFKHDGRNVLVVPMQSGSKRIGFLLLSDMGELEFTSSELGIVRNIKNHLTALIIRTWDYMDITQRMEKMNQLMQISHDLIRVVNMTDLENAIVAAAIDFTNATRGFLIKRDSEGNNLYQVQMDQDKQLLSTTTGISKTALSLCQTNLEMVYTFNAMQDGAFKNSISVQDYAINTIFCCPILVDDVPMGFLYLDNHGDSTREMYLNEDIINLLLNQFGVAISNARQYENLIQKSAELNAFEQLKDEFMAIVSHELNTPLSTLQGYMSRLKRNLYADEEDREGIMGKLETAVNRLTATINDITTMNLYNVTKSLPKAPVSVSDIIDLVHQEVSILSRNRHMQFKVEVEAGLPPVNAHWEALHRMIYNIVINSVRFTNEFGTIVLGARKSSFPQEKIGNKDTLVIFVRDNGIGIPQYRLKDIFRKFYELNEIYAHKSGTTEYRSSGLGLGLAIAKRIAELHGGDIVIKSKENEGTSVFMLIPFK